MLNIAPGGMQQYPRTERETQKSRAVEETEQ
jgi:hypothetical protein